MIVHVNNAFAKYATAWIMVSWEIIATMYITLMITVKMKQRCAFLCDAVATTFQQ